MPPKIVRKAKKSTGRKTTECPNEDEPTSNFVSDFESFVETVILLFEFYIQSSQNLLDEQAKTLQILRERDNQLCELKSQVDDLQQNIRSSESESQSVADELQSTKCRLFDALNLNVQLKNDLRSAQRCLERETGETFSAAQQSAAGKSTWRGRAQQICLLQAKITELRTQQSVLMPDTDPKIEQLRHVNAQRRQEIDQLQKQLNAARETSDENRSKLVAQRVRNKNLQDEINVLKERVREASAKSEQDARENVELNVGILYR